MPAAWFLVPPLLVAGIALLPTGSLLVGWLLAGSGLCLQILLMVRGGSRMVRAADIPSWTALPVGAVILAVAAALRLWRLDSLPEGLWYDEAEAGLEALRILSGEGGIFAHYTDNTALPYWIVAGVFALVGPSSAAIRVVSAAAGVVTVVCCYLAGREAAGRGGGLAAAWVGAVMAWGITFSRLGMPYMLGALFMSASCWLLLRAFRTSRVCDFAVAGIVAGIGQYSYTTFRVFLPAMVGVTIVALLARGRRRTLAAGLAVLWLCLAAVVAPLIVASARQPSKYFGRMVEASALADRGGRPVAKILRGNLTSHLGMFHLRGDPNGRHNLPGRPMLDPVTGAGLLLGAAAVWTLPPPVAAVVTLLFAGGLAGGVLSLPFEAPQGARTSGLIPLVALLAGIGWWGWYRVRPPGRAPAIAGGLLLAGLAVGSVCVNARWYFVEQARDFSCWSSHSPGPTWVARRWGTESARGDVLIAPTYQGQRTIEFLAPQMRTDRIFEPQRDLPFDPSGGGVFAALSGFDAPSLDIIGWLYPCERQEGTLRERGGVPARGRGLLELLTFPSLPMPEAAVAIIPAAVLEATSGWRQRPDGTVTTIVNLPVPGRVGSEDGASGISIDGGTPGALATAGLHLASGPPSAARVPLRLRTGDGSTVPLAALYASDRLPPGWRAEYRALGGGEGFSRFEWRPDRYVHLLPLPRPYAVEWRGILTVPQAGEHAFFIRAVGRAELRIDDRSVVTAGPEGEDRGAVVLDAGRHRVTLSFLDDRPYSQIFLDWEPPGGARQPLPYGLVTVVD